VFRKDPRPRLVLRSELAGTETLTNTSIWPTPPSVYNRENHSEVVEVSNARNLTKYRSEKQRPRIESAKATAEEASAMLL